jgi:hypothetical protein
VNYRDVYDKDKSRKLYYDFVRHMRELAWECVHPPDKQMGPDALRHMLAEKAKCVVGTPGHMLTVCVCNAAHAASIAV